MTPQERRLARLETTKREAKPAPNILRVPFGQTIEQARADFAAAYSPKPGHCVLVVPAKPRTEAEREIYAERFRERQLALVAAARRERVETPKAAPNEPRATFPQGGTVAPPKGRAFIPWTRNA